MKVKKIACLLTALVISASAAMVPAVANAAAGEEVTVSSTTSYVEGKSQSYDYDSAMGLWSGVNLKEADKNRFGIAKGTMSFDNVFDCIMEFKTKMHSGCYYAFKLSDGTISKTVKPEDNAAADRDIKIIINKNGTSTINIKAKKEYTASYTSKDGVTVESIIAVADTSAHKVYVDAPVTITPLTETIEKVTATEATPYTEDNVTDKIGFYGSAKVSGASRINWYANNGSEWVKGDFDAPTVTAENADVTFGLIIEGDNAATAIKSAAYNLD